MSEEQTLNPVAQKTVDFCGDERLAIRAEDGQVYVSVRLLCEALGLARQGQMRRIRDHDILSEGYQGGNVLFAPSADGRGGVLALRVTFTGCTSPAWAIRQS